MNKYTLLALLLVPLLVIGVGVAVVGGAVVGIGSSFSTSPASCSIDDKFFADSASFESFLNQGGCNTACAVSAEGTADGYADAQVANVKKIIGVGQLMNIPEKGQIIAIMTALAESGIKNYANDGIYNTTKNPADRTQSPSSGIFDFAKTSLNYSYDAVGSDATSVGMFQQQAWWGNLGSSTWQSDPTNTMKRLMDPYYGSQKFFTRMLQVAGWESQDPGAVAQRVQVSAVPGAYNRQLVKATQLYNTYKTSATQPDALYDLGGNGVKTGEGEEAATVCGTSVLPLDKNAQYQITAQFAQPRGGGGGFAGSSGNHQGLDIDCGDTFENIYSMTAGVVVTATPGNSSGRGYPMGQVSVKMPDGVRIDYLHGRNVKVSVGDLVSPGQPIAECASTGPSTGSHLHITLNVSGTDRADMKALPTVASRPTVRDAALGMKLYGTDICPPYTADRTGKPAGAPLTIPLKCWPREEWVR